MDQQGGTDRTVAVSSVLLDNLLRSLDHRLVAHDAALEEVRNSVSEASAALAEQLKSGFEQVSKRLDDVCDVGKAEHKTFEQAILATNRRLDAADIEELARLRKIIIQEAAEKHGAEKLVNGGVRGLTWILEHGGRVIVALIALGGAGTLAANWYDDVTGHDTAAAVQAQPVQVPPGYVLVPIPPVTNQQPEPTQAHAEDWPLRTR